MGFLAYTHHNVRTSSRARMCAHPRILACVLSPTLTRTRTRPHHNVRTFSHLYIYINIYMILRTTHKLLVQSLLIIRLKTSTSKTKMETVGALPAPDVILPTTIIHLFGIVSENGIEEKQCHFCFGAIEAEELLSMDTPCCPQGAHCDCFRYWAASSVVGGTVRCGYCRTLFPDNQLCFLCLEKRTTTNSLW